MSDTYALLRTAILHKQPVVLDYHGHTRHICPHVLGTTGGESYVLAFQFAGSSESVLPPGGEWRCLELRKIVGARMQDGPWHTRGNYAHPQNCVAQIDVKATTV